MGEAKLKKSSKERFLEDHPLCIYCGQRATTTDHCPPRCFFLNRIWPENYEFPACAECNAEARKDEQVLGILARTRLADTTIHEQEEWQRQLRGLWNTQPEVINEWTSLTRNQQRRSVREAFGELGDEMRRAGWGSIHIGPLTEAAFWRFMVKLSKALYYRHNRIVFEGVMYARQINPLRPEITPEVLEDILHLAPKSPVIARSKKSLEDQFIYRFNHNSESGVMYAVAQFSEQMMFQLIVLSWAAFSEMEVRAKELNRPMPPIKRHACWVLNGVMITQDFEVPHRT